LDRTPSVHKASDQSGTSRAELSTLSLHDALPICIGRYLGLEPITVGQSQHDCVMLEYAGGDKLYIPVENIDVLSRYGSGEEAAVDRKSTRLNSSHVKISYAVFCLKKKRISVRKRI